MITDVKQLKRIIAETEAAITASTGFKCRLVLHLKTSDKQHPLLLKACKIWQVAPHILYERTRKQQVVIKRQILALLLNRKTLLSLKQIAMQIGLNDHSETIHARQRCMNNLQINDVRTLKYYEPVKHLFDD